MSHRPIGLDGPALGTPSTSSLIDKHRYWRVNRPVDQVWSSITSQHPGGLEQAGSAHGTGPGEAISDGLAWSEPDRVYAIGLQLEVSVASSSAGHVTFVRADGIGEWLDPRPFHDTAHGPRMRVTVAGKCPRSDRSMVGVRNSGSDLARRLLPDALPTAAQICEYGGLNPPGFGLKRSARLVATEASQLAQQYQRLPIPHTDGGDYSCGMDTGSVIVTAISYPGRPDVDLWEVASGCASVANGAVRVTGAADLSHWLAPAHHDS
jgi:hypothetical protein